MENSLIMVLHATEVNEFSWQIYKA